MRHEGGAPLENRLCLLGFVNRSGSNLLGEYLRSLPGVSGFGEKLNHTVVTTQCQRLGLDSFPEYIRWLANQTNGQDLGIKASGHQVEMLHNWNILNMFRDVRALHIVRQDVVSQAVSMWVAIHTKQWSSRHAPRMHECEIPYDADAIRRLVEKIGLNNSRIMTAFSVLGIPTHTTVYERLIADPHAEMKIICDFLKLESSAWQLPTKLNYERQSSAIKTDFVARARADLVSNW